MPDSLDVVIKGGTVVLRDEVRRLDIGIKNGKIVQLAEALDSEGVNTLDAKGLYVLPGMVDVHVHLNEPGLGDWEGFSSGSAALAAGGCTTYIDMPLNGRPPTVSLSALKQKLKAAESESYVDFALWGGLVPGHLDQLELLAMAGVVGFKAFMSDPGGEGEDIFTRADDLTLYEGMKRIASLQRILALHAENDDLVSRLTGQKRALRKSSARDFVESRPIVAELEAVNRALFYAEQTGCALHFVHISSQQAVNAIHKAKQKGLDVTLETCPHYLTLTDEDLEVKGPVAKCAPPLRSLAEQEGLWTAVSSGYIDMISSDHSPCPGELKEHADFFEAWGGISGAQSSMQLIIHEGFIKRGIPLPLLSRMLSYHPAKRFGLHPRKGEIMIGADADLALVDMNRSYTLESKDLLYRHPHSPYIGRTFSCTVAKTMSRGRIVYDADKGLAADKNGMWIQVNTDWNHRSGSISDGRG